MVKHLQDKSLLTAHLVAWLSYHIHFARSMQVARDHRAVTLRACIQRVPTSILELPIDSNLVNKHVNRYEIYIDIEGSHIDIESFCLENI
jgi:hypothetical protein